MINLEKMCYFLNVYLNCSLFCPVSRFSTRCFPAEDMPLTFISLALPIFRILITVQVYLTVFRLYTIYHKH